MSCAPRRAPGSPPATRRDSRQVRSSPGHPDNLATSIAAPSRIVWHRQRSASHPMGSPRDADTSHWPRPLPTGQRADCGWRGMNTGPDEPAPDAPGRARESERNCARRSECLGSYGASSKHRSHHDRWRASGAAVVSAKTCRILGRRVGRADRGIYVIDPAVNRQPPPVLHAFGPAAAYPFETPRRPFRRRGRAGIKPATQNY